MRLLRALIKSTLTRRLASAIGAGYIGLVYLTSRWRFLGTEHTQPYLDEGKPFLVCFWHNRIAMMCFAWQSKVPFSMLNSGHADGQMVAGVVAYYGIGGIKGSTSKGGVSAIRNIIRAVRSGHTVGITPDGPKGPLYKVSPGTAAIAKLAGIDIIPVTYATTRCIQLNTWDRFLVPLPFSKGVFMWGNPIRVTKDMQDTDILQAVEQTMHRITQEADHLCKRPTS